ncbi:hypothetical protein KIH74_09025 [Kineosporia sp. J2-2]|uniref:Trehalose 2-sulfotransferase n=1 Tax=Kineosporia corallincola TaxID=2835133 RepID=A0ABS5TDA4_9ACTN|nr:Stf0 family sulfotransferase [Kineosporia corallincola]MBT0769066.1 hypothetical protein [Kineosporia corallincola]
MRTRAATYVVAATPRSGSTLLCEGLQATGVAGRPAELFGPLLEHTWKTAWGLPANVPDDEFVRAALRYGTTGNGVFGMKMHWQHVRFLAGRLGVCGPPGAVLDALVPRARFVRIVRRDRRAQAVSLFRAYWTEEWVRFPGSGPPRRPAGELRFDRAEIERLEASIEAESAGWQEFFDRRGIEPLMVEYEELDRDYGRQIARVLDHLGADPRAVDRIPAPRLQRQSDRLNAHWIELLEG